MIATWGEGRPWLRVYLGVRGRRDIAEDHSDQRECRSAIDQVKSLQGIQRWWLLAPGLVA